MEITTLINLATRLEAAGLQWDPEIGDEVIDRSDLDKVGILVDPQGLSSDELRGNYLWLPSIEQLILEVEHRDAIIFHAGSTGQNHYEVVLKTAGGLVRASGIEFRIALGNAFVSLLCEEHRVELH